MEVTLERAVAEVDLFARVSNALRALEADENVRQVIVSDRLGEVVVIGSDYSHVALRVTA